MSTIDDAPVASVPVPGSHPFVLTRRKGWVRSMWGENGPATHQAHLSDALAACMYDNALRWRIVDEHETLCHELIDAGDLEPDVSLARMVSDLAECNRLIDTHGVAERAGIAFKTVGSYFQSGHLVMPAFRWGREHGEAKSIWTVGQIDRWLRNRPGAGRPATHDLFGTPYPPRRT